MKSIKTLKNVVEMQYLLENLIEDYNECQYDSDKYYIKFHFLNMLSKRHYSAKTILNYMKLDENKFSPFIKLLESNSQINEKKLFIKSHNKNLKVSDNSNKGIMFINVESLPVNMEGNS